MRKETVIFAGIGALVIATGAGLAVSNSRENTARLDRAEKAALVAAAPAPKKTDYRVVATNETGFVPATMPVPVRPDAGDKQALKGKALGAAIGAIAGDVIDGKSGLGAAAGAGAGGRRPSRQSGHAERRRCAV